MEPHRWYTKSAHVYDVVYEAVVDYDTEAATVVGLVRERVPDAQSLVEFGSGTGLFLSRLADEFEVVGSDISQEMLDECRRKYPDLEVVRGDYVEVDLGRRFDVAVCLFASVAYTLTKDRLQAAIRNMADHLEPGGVLITDGWVRPQDLVDGYMASYSHVGDRIIVDRASHTRLEGEQAIVDMGHMVTTADGFDFFVERHELGVFSDDEFVAALRQAGLIDVQVVDTWQSRARTIGTKPAR